MELEEPEDARIMLSRAVECCPTSVEVSFPGLWFLVGEGGVSPQAPSRNTVAELVVCSPTSGSCW